jgi:hypothetical protein
MITIETSQAVTDVGIGTQPHFCLSCGCLRLDWLGWAWRCQACGELDLPPEVLCCWCRSAFPPEDIQVHKTACSRLNWSADMSTAWAKQYEWPEENRRMFMERPASEFRVERF